MKIIYCLLFIQIILTFGEQQCTQEKSHIERYDAASNKIFQSIESARKYKSCPMPDEDCSCHEEVINSDLKPYEAGITKEMLQAAAKYGTRYKILNGRLYRDADCMFITRCTGVEHFIFNILDHLPNMDLIINVRDWPQLPQTKFKMGPVFSFSKTKDYIDVMYPAWTFWAGGPAISLYPTGIGRWDILRENITTAARNVPWHKKKSLGFFRGSRTSDERDSLVLLSRRQPKLVDAQYTKNQAWKSPKDTLNAEPASEVSFEEHCNYKYLFNFRGVAASFRLKHLFLCKSLVFHVGNEWNEFFYFSLKPWVHYVPLDKYPTEQQLESMLLFFRHHDDIAQEIAQRGYEYIWQHLRMRDVQCYWEKLLLRYQQLLKFSVQPDKQLIEITPKPARAQKH